MTVSEYLDASPGEVAIFEGPSTGFWKATIRDSSPEQVEVYLVKNTRQKGLITITGDSVDGPKGLRWNSIMQAMRILRGLAQNTGELECLNR